MSSKTPSCVSLFLFPHLPPPAAHPPASCLRAPVRAHAGGVGVGVGFCAGRSRANSLTDVGAGGDKGALRQLYSPYTPKYATVLKHKMFNTELKVRQADGIILDHLSRFPCTATHTPCDMSSSMPVLVGC